MIATSCNDKTTQALMQLSACPAIWNPCGSRFFGDSTDASDFDFFAEHSIVAQNYLALRGFVNRPVAYCFDVNTVSVFEKGRVHAIFVKSVKARILVQTFLKNVSKKVRRDYQQWNGAYANLAPELFSK